MADDLMSASDTEDLRHTFEAFQTQYNELELPKALACVAARGDISTVFKCLRMTHDNFPGDKLCVNHLIHNTFYEISCITHDADSFANIITSFTPSDVKPLVCIRARTIYRKDNVGILKCVMAKRPELITDDLPNWLASHEFEIPNYLFFPTTHEKAFQYLASLATQSVLERALSIVKDKGHYTVETREGGTLSMCCLLQNSFHQNLFTKLNSLLQLVEARSALINDLAILPSVLSTLVLEYTACDIPSDHSISKFEAVIQKQCCIIN